MIRIYKASDADPLLRVAIERGDDGGTEEILFTNRAMTKRYRLQISSTGISLDLVSQAAALGWAQKEKAA